MESNKIKAAKNCYAFMETEMAGAALDFRVTEEEEVKFNQEYKTINNNQGSESSRYFINFQQKRTFTSSTRNKINSTTQMGSFLPFALLCFASEIRKTSSNDS